MNTYYTTHSSEKKKSSSSSSSSSSNHKIERGFKRKVEKQGNAWAIHKKYR